MQVRAWEIGKETHKFNEGLVTVGTEVALDVDDFTEWPAKLNKLLLPAQPWKVPQMQHLRSHRVVPEQPLLRHPSWHLRDLHQRQPIQTLITGRADRFATEKCGSDGSNSRVRVGILRERGLLCRARKNEARNARETLSYQAAHLYTICRKKPNERTHVQVRCCESVIKKET